MNLKNGEFAVWNVDLSGKADIASNALLHVNILNVNKNGTLTNNGKLELEDNAGTAASFVQQGTVANKANALLILQHCQKQSTKAHSIMKVKPRATF